MKKILCLMCVAALGLAACSKNKKEETANSTYNTNYNITTADARNGNTKSAKDAKYQIIDQEFDNMLAPETDYEAIPAHELQACEDSYLPLVEPDCCGNPREKGYQHDEHLLRRWQPNDSRFLYVHHQNRL